MEKLIYCMYDPQKRKGEIELQYIERNDGKPKVLEGLEKLYFFTPNDNPDLEIIESLIHTSISNYVGECFTRKIDIVDIVSKTPDKINDKQKLFTGSVILTLDGYDEFDYLKNIRNKSFDLKNVDSPALFRKALINDNRNISLTFDAITHALFNFMAVSCEKDVDDREVSYEVDHLMENYEFVVDFMKLFQCLLKKYGSDLHVVYPGTIMNMETLDYFRYIDDMYGITDDDESIEREIDNVFS